MFNVNLSSGYNTVVYNWIKYAQLLQFFSFHFFPPLYTVNEGEGVMGGDCQPNISAAVALLWYVTKNIDPDCHYVIEGG